LEEVHEKRTKKSVILLRLKTTLIYRKRREKGKGGERGRGTFSTVHKCILKGRHLDQKGGGGGGKKKCYNFSQRAAEVKIILLSRWF